MRQPLTKDITGHMIRVTLSEALPIACLNSVVEELALCTKFCELCSRKHGAS